MKIMKSKHSEKREGGGGNVKQAAAPRALAAKYYTDAAIYAQELDAVIARTWQFVGHLSQLQKAGDYFVFELGGESGFCTRDQKGEVRAFYNVCQHRGHQLLQGCGNTRHITCPYHSWAYELDGRFKSAPNIRAVPNFDRDSVRLSKMQVENFNGFIFVNMDAEARPMDEWFPGVREQLREYVPNIEKLMPALWMEIPEKCNWKVSVENYSECYHCALNHKAFTSGIIRPETYDIQPHGRCLRHETECQDLSQMAYSLDLEAPHAGEYRTWFLWPMSSFQVYPGNALNTYHWRAHDEKNVTVWRGWYSIDGEKTPEVLDMAKRDRETTVEEDIALVESVQRGLQSRGYRPGPLVLDPKGGVNSEHSLQALHSWYLEAMEGEIKLG